MNEFHLISLALMGIGFLVAQLPRSRRGATIAGALGVASMVAVFVVVWVTPDPVDDVTMLGNALIFAASLSLAYGFCSGALTSYVALSLKSSNVAIRWAGTAAAFAVFAFAGFYVLFLA
jgi:hypothetical protein